MYTILSLIFANDDDQEMMSSVLVLLQDITHFDDNNAGRQCYDG
jgi:hypothetical protein